MSKHDKCLRILKTYGVLVDFDGKFRENAGKGKSAKETIAGWKKRVLGSGVENLVFYIPTELAPQMRMKSLKEAGGASHVIRMMSELTRLKELELGNTLSESESELVEEYSTIPKRTLSDVVDSFEDDLEPSVQEFFERFLKNTDRRADSRELLTELAKAYNTVVGKYRILAGLNNEKV